MLSDVLFCASDARQCLDRAGAFSAAFVVAGGAVRGGEEESGDRGDAEAEAPFSWRSGGEIDTEHCL